MTRFTHLQTEESLGATFFNGKERSFFATKEELSLLWSLDENDLIIADNSWEGNTIGDLLDLISKSHHSTKEEIEKRFGKQSAELGLGLKTSISDDGRLFFTR
tara:strand:+ start:260 stop:568 length:309 start_codon:yes stop_codon:yes gene_type:complete